MKKALPCGILASAFFAFTFILNRSMNLGGGYWMWSGALRYLFTLPMLTVILICKGKGTAALKPVLSDIRKQSGNWFLWSTVGFGLFYLPMTLASTYGESWLTAASWQFTIVAGVLLTPLFGKKIPVKNLLLSCLILAGIFLMEVQNVSASGSLSGNMKALLLILIAAFMYPLGNRKTMSFCPESLDTLQRVFGMTLCSWPFWLVVAGIAEVTGGSPALGQVIQSFGVALFSSVLGTLLFFHATDLVRSNPKQLAVIEATQCGEVVFTLLGGIIVLGDNTPGLMGFIGIAMIIVGMILNSLASSS